jgi:hypothetical protein
MVQGGKKDAWYIVKIFLSIMRKFDPHKNIINVLAFDGDSNVQNTS